MLGRDEIVVGIGYVSPWVRQALTVQVQDSGKNDCMPVITFEASGPAIVHTIGEAAHTLNEVKQRTRFGMSLCQGKKWRTPVAHRLGQNQVNRLRRWGH